MPEKSNQEKVVQDSSAGADAQADCRTLPLVPAFSLCLKGDRFCRYALSFGHQYLCRHPEHENFQIPPSDWKK